MGEQQYFRAPLLQQVVILIIARKSLHTRCKHTQKEQIPAQVPIQNSCNYQANMRTAYPHQAQSGASTFDSVLCILRNPVAFHFALATIRVQSPSPSFFFDFRCSRPMKIRLPDTRVESLDTCTHNFSSCISKDLAALFVHLFPGGN